MLRFYKYDDVGDGVVKGCPINYFTVPVTFKNKGSFVRLTGYVEGSYSLNVRFEFRTYQENGLLMFHRFSSEGFVQVKSPLFINFRTVDSLQGK